MGDNIPRLYDDVASSSRRQPTSDAAEREAEGRLGKLLAGKYHLESVLGVGGMAYVFAATNRDSGHKVAIKMLQLEFGAQETVVARFVREATTANMVRHPNVVQVHDVGKDEMGVPFLVQELLEGESLLDYLIRNGNSLGIEETIAIMLPILDALGDAHAKGIVHRDIKPENVFLVGPQRIPKLLDFGISKMRMPGQEATAVGILLGTPAYMAPELVRAARDADARSDIWALGVLIFELVSGKVPFIGDNVAQTFLAITTKEPRKLSEVRPGAPAKLSRVIERCLARNAADRYQTAGELAADLKGVLEETRSVRAQRAALAAMAATLPVNQGLAVEEKPRPVSTRGGTVVMTNAPAPRETPAHPRHDVTLRAADAPLATPPKAFVPEKDRAPKKRVLEKKRPKLTKLEIGAIVVTVLALAAAAYVVMWSG